MIVLHKTAYSYLCKDVFEKTGKGLNIAQNNFYIARKMLLDGYNEAENNDCGLKLDYFINFLKSNKLKLLYFAFAYDNELNRYVFQYVVRSILHKTHDFDVQGVIDETDIAFVFFPMMFSRWLLQILNSVPFSRLEDVANGN